MTLADSSYPLLNLFWTFLVIFGWIIWIGLLITVYSDLFRRHDISGWTKTLWILLTFILPLLGTFIYLVSQGKGMTERNIERNKQAKADVDNYVRSVAAPHSADQIAKAKELLDSGVITQDEFATMKAKALAS